MFLSRVISRFPLHQWFRDSPGGFNVRNTGGTTVYVQASVRNTGGTLVPVSRFVRNTAGTPVVVS